ncbi:ABC transporter substrate-binding protein [Leisingera thetidis]|uniref:ABC transporter substrate-binding protein n=1 Tax=Leisingera thetidis TaxID=2930199 RepID=UPI0021F7E6FC|nr:ABC transporter substrate-binding protein [Leisingera thetidis]
MNHYFTRRSLLAGAGAIGAGALLGANGLPMPAYASTPKSGGTFRIGTSDSSLSDSLDPQLIETRFISMLQMQVRNCLIEAGPNGVLQPELAESWEAAADQKTWVFKLRKGVEFHNGRTLTAADVVYSVNLHRGDDTKSSNKALLAHIEEISATSPHEVTIKLSAPDAGFAHLMSIEWMPIIPEGDTDYNAGNGTGGYILDSFEPGTKSVATRNPNYWKEGRAHFDSVEILAIADVTARTTALRTGQIHAMNFVDPKTARLLSRQPGIDLIQTPGKAHYAFAMRTDTDPYTDVKVRQALKYAIDREDVLQKILGGYGSIGNDHPISTAYPNCNANLEQHAYDPEKARALMKEAGAEDVTVKLHVSDTPFTGAVDMAQLFSEHAAAAGINIEVVREPEDGYWSSVWSVKPFFATRWSGRVTEDAMLSSAYSEAAIASGWNETKWSTERLEAILSEARGEGDAERREALYHEAQAIIHNDGGIVVPVFADFIDAKTSNVAHGELSNGWDMDGLRCSERWWFDS